MVQWLPMAREKREKRIITWTDIDTYHEFYKIKDKAGYKKNHEFVKELLDNYRSHNAEIEFTG